MTTKQLAARLEKLAAMAAAKPEIELEKPYDFAVRGKLAELENFIAGLPDEDEAGNDAARPMGAA